MDCHGTSLYLVYYDIRPGNGRVPVILITIRSSNPRRIALVSIVTSECE